MSYKCICDLCGKPMTNICRFNRYYFVKTRKETERKFQELDICQDCWKEIEAKIQEKRGEKNERKSDN